MKPKKWIAGLLIAMFLVAAVGVVPPVQAATGTSLEQAIKIAKSSFTIPEEYTEFSSHYNEYGERLSWLLNWRDKGGEISIEVDAQTGDILRMSHYQVREQSAVKLPELSYQAAKAIADRLVEKLQPERKQDLVYHEDPEKPSLDVNPWGPPTYNFRYQRVVEGIPFPSNGITISVNGDTGEIVSYSFDWYGEKLQVPEQLLTAEEAQKIFAREFPLELQYFRTQPEERDEKPVIKPVFKLRHPQLVKIDPVTGKILESEDEYGIAEDMARGGMAMAGEAKMELTPEEAKEIAKIDKLISKEEAIQKAMAVLNLSDQYRLESSRLQQSWDEPERVVWQLSWQSSRDKEYRGSAAATVDGETGELLSFYRYEYDEEQNKKDPVYNREQSQELALEFIKKLQPEKAKSIRLYEPVTVRTPEKARSYGFVYERLVNGIPFPQNGFRVTVNAVTGQVEGYNMQWTAADFPRLDTVIDESQATAWYGQEVPLSLEFVTSYDRETGKQKVTLMYHLAKVPYTMMDAVSGNPLNWRGEPLEKKLPAVFSDIENHPAQKDIELLVAAGVIAGTEDGKFHPDQAITQGELAEILAKLEGNRGPIIPLPILTGSGDAWYTPWINQAVSKGLIKADEIAPEETVTREFLAATLIRHLGLEKAAALSEIYKVDFADKDQITPKYLGHVALADGLKIISPGENFLPKKQVTKAEAVTAVVRALQLD